MDGRNTNGRTALRAAGRVCVIGLATLAWAVLWAATSRS